MSAYVLHKVFQQKIPADNVNTAELAPKYFLGQEACAANQLHQGDPREP